MMGKIGIASVCLAHFSRAADATATASVPVTRPMTGETKTVRLHAPARQLQSWSLARQAWITPPGPSTISVGASSRDPRLEQRIDIP